VSWLAHGVTGGAAANRRKKKKRCASVCFTPPIRASAPIKKKGSIVMERSPSPIARRRGCPRRRREKWGKMKRAAERQKTGRSNNEGGEKMISSSAMTPTHRKTGGGKKGRYKGRTTKEGRGRRLCHVQRVNVRGKGERERRNLELEEVLTSGK